MSRSCRSSESWRQVVGVHGETHPELVQAAELLIEIHADLEPHLQKQEQMLFPMIRSLATASSRPSFHCGSIANPISVMEHEDTAVGSLLERLRQITNGYQAPAGTCASKQSLMARRSWRPTPTCMCTRRTPSFPGGAGAGAGAAVGGMTAMMAIAVGLKHSWLCSTPLQEEACQRRNVQLALIQTLRDLIP